MPAPHSQIAGERLIDQIVQIALTDLEDSQTLRLNITNEEKCEEMKDPQKTWAQIKPAVKDLVTDEFKQKTQEEVFKALAKIIGARLIGRMYQDDLAENIGPAWLQYLRDKQSSDDHDVLVQKRRRQ